MFVPAQSLREEVDLPRKRQRPTISCTECHRRKQKCDRKQPCLRCVKRGLEVPCLYETSNDPVITGSIANERFTLDNAVNLVSSDTIEIPSLPNPGKGTLESPPSSGSHITASLGYADNNTGTRSIMDIIGVPSFPQAPNSKLANEVAFGYKALVRQLPPKKYIDKLVRLFFTDISWQYDVVDKDIFMEQLTQWERVPYASRATPCELDPTIRHFPALLFQILAQAVLLQPQRQDEVLDDLMQAPDMNLIDLATEFSNAGDQILSILGFTEPSLVRVQSVLHRAIFLKTTGSVIEAWHMLGSAIRDAQELGLHRSYLSPIIDTQVDLQETRLVAAGRKIWLVLHLWDAHMGVVLGRPMITKFDPETVPFPRCGSFGRVEDGGGPVQQITPFDFILCGYHTAYKHLQDIHKVESSKTDALEAVDRINASILVGIACMPAWAQPTGLVHENQYSWLPSARETLFAEIRFTLLALHRPFVFAHTRNRIQALKAALEIFESQIRLSRLMEPRKFPTFNLVFATFDATVIVAGIYILYPKENPEHLQKSLQCIQWALESLHAMKTQSVLAASAYTAVNAIYEKLLCSISNAHASTQVFRNLSQQDPRHVAGNPTPNQTSLAGPQLESAPAASQGFEQHLPRSPLHGLVPQDLPTNGPPMHFHNVGPFDTGEAFAALDGHRQFSDHRNVVPPRPLHDLMFQESMSDMPSMPLHDIAADNTSESHVAAYDFWQVLENSGD